MPEFKKIVVTGAAGFVGSHVAEAIVEKYPDSHIVLFDKMTYASHSDNVIHLLRDKRVEFQLADLCDPDACVKAATGADLVVHLAAESHVDNSFGNSLLFTRSNVLGTHTLAEAARSNNVGLFVHVSTDEVYGQILEGDVDETAKLNPTNPYSASKAAAEMVLNGYQKSYGMPIIMVRANNIFGVRQFPEKILPTFIMRMLHGMTLQIHGSGKNCRRYLAATDFAAGVLKIIEKGTIGEAYNIGSDEEFTNAEVANMICGLFDRDPAEWVTYVDDRPFNDFRYAISYDKVKALGWSRKVNVADRLPQMITWYSENQERYPHFTRLAKGGR
jgi:UDP-glucose 4,6-dehydratase